MKKMMYWGTVIFSSLLVSFMLNSTFADDSLELRTGALVYVYYNSQSEPPGNIPQPFTFNLVDYVLQLPAGMSRDDLTFSIVDDSQLINGSLSLLNNKGEITFTPADDFYEGIPYLFTYRAEGYSSNGQLYSKDGVLKVVVLDFEIKPETPGYFDNTGTRCYSDMGEVDFIPRYKFISGAYDDARVLRNYGVKVSNSGRTSLYVNGGRIYDFQQPLVGDLDGDGKPEIIALGTEENNGVLDYNPYVRYIYIFDGQTGKVVGQHDLTTSCSWMLGAIGNHGSPGAMVLVDSDRDGKKEIILSTGWGNSMSSTLIKRLLSFVVSKNGQTWSIVRNPKWNSTSANGVSSTRYDVYGNNQTYSNNRDFTKPVLQVVDLDGDGKPEVIAYNKIYNAVDGRLIMTLEDLRDSGDEATKAYVGRDKLAKEKQTIIAGDHQVAFSYIYDINFDGKYEICAGGKVYYDISTAQKTYKVLNASQYVGETIPDGHTSVADIDSDGNPEVITSYLTNLNSNHRIMVWSPDLSPSSKGATLKAKLDIPLLSPDGATGSHSYIYIADIDGREQYGKKFPEISILGPRYYANRQTNGRWEGYPKHPNVLLVMNDYYPQTAGDTQKGILLSFTWDDTPNLPVNQRLKVSFMMEHQDMSCNTGFALFDFDNDGVSDICYRDNTSLRIISASKPYVALNSNDPSIIKFKSNLYSATGFEFPIITDLDNDFSADMLVTGNDDANDITSAYLYAIEGSTANLAPARTVWNQFMYSPFKIKDDLTTPLPGEMDHPLSPKYAFFMKETDTNETYVFNNTLTQVPIFGIFEKDGRRYIKPVVRTPDAVIDTAFINKNSFTYGSLDFKLSNTGDASINENTPIKIYKDVVGADKIYETITVGRIIYPGEGLILYQIPFKNSTDYGENYIIRVGDDSFTDGKGDVWHTRETSYKDCYWPDNEIEVGVFVLRSDYYTVYTDEKSIILDILPNDIFQIYKDNNQNVPSIGDFAFRYPQDRDYGKIEIDYTENKIKYDAPSTGGLVHIYYSITGFNEFREGNIYIYVLEKCVRDFPPLGDPYTLCMKPIPQDVYFNWYDQKNVLLEDNQKTFIIETENPYSFYVQPIFNNWQEYSFLKDYLPKRLFEVIASENGRLMKWMGWNTSWDDATNWVVIKENGEVPATSPPKNIDNVIIPSERPYYPLLIAPAQCSGIDMRNRSMLAGSHHLTYDSVKIELKLISSERDRFIMWSAPLKSVYSGDYHFKNSEAKPQWGDVYMNFFQSKNPDDPSSKAYKNMFTATFGSPGERLDLGTAFNLKVIQTSFNYDKSFFFPQKDESYTYIRDGQQITDQLNREKRDRFITDDYPLSGVDNTFDLPVKDEVGFKFIQMVNPYVAYLDVFKFLDANDQYISPAYKIWTGRVNEDNITIYVGEPPASGQRLIITDGNLPMEYVDQDGVKFISPLQSFFIMKKNDDDDITTLKMSPEWTTTINPYYSNPYVYSRSNDYINTPPVLKMKVSQQDKVSSTGLYYKKTTTYGITQNENTNSQKLFYEETPLSVYTLSLSGDPLAINTITEESPEVKIGIRTNLSGSVKLEFSGMESFENDLFLVDHGLDKNNMINIKEKQVYPFSIDQSPPGKFIEINNRFSLLMVSPTNISDNDEDKLNIFSDNGSIHIYSSGESIDGLQVYDASGHSVYISNETTTQHIVPVLPDKLYIIRVSMGKDIKIRKLFIK